MNFVWLWAHIMLTTVVVGLPFNNQGETFSNSDFQLSQWSPGQSSYNQESPSQASSYDDYQWSNEAEVSEPLEPSEPSFSRNVKRGGSNNLDYYSETLRNLLKQQKKKMIMNRRLERKTVKKNANKELISDSKDVIVCKEVPYNICFRVDKDGTLVPLSHADEPRPVRLLRVY